MPANREIEEKFPFRTRVLWITTSLMLTVSDRTWGQTPAELPTLVFSIEENSPGGTEVGALAELYPDLNHFRFSNRSRTTLFQIHTDTGVISVRDGARLDFERRPVVTLTIVADIREEHEDPYLAEFAESLRDEGFSSRTLSRLIPLEQRIQVQVQLRDVDEAVEATMAANSDVRSQSAVAGEESVVVPVTEPTSSDATSLTTQVDPDATDPAIFENGSPKKAPPVIHTPSNELYPPATQRLTPKSTVEPVRVPEIATPVEVIKGTDDSAVPMPTDVPPVAEESSTGNGKTLTLSESSGQAALQLNEAVAAGDGSTTSNSTDTTIDQTEHNAEMESAEVASQLQSTFLMRSFVSLMIVLGTAYLLRHRWKSFKKSLPKPQEEQATNASASNELDKLTADVASDEQAEMKAADEFVKELIPEETEPQLEQAIKAVITQRSDEDNGSPFDPESLIDDEYFSDSDNLQSLKARNAELGDRLEALAGTAVSAPVDSIQIDRLFVTTTASSESGSTDPGDEQAETTENKSGDSDSESFERSHREDRSEFPQGRRSYLTFDQDAAPLAEPRWNSDWPGYSDEKPSPSSVPATEAVAVLATESSAVIEVTDEKIASLRNELADLFAIQKKTEVEETNSVIPVQPNPADIEQPAFKNETADKSELCAEETHLESVAQYLSQLLERSKKEEAADAIFVDRRKSGEKTPGKWDGADRRSVQKAKAPVKSYIESYLSEHGGDLSHDAGLQKSSETTSDESFPSSEPKPLIERRPVDVQAIRQHMNSFRNVASTALEHALASHQIRQAKGKVAGRTTLVVGLTLVSVLAIATNSAMKIYFPSLGWLIGLIICLAIAELILRIEAIRRHRRELRYRILEPAKKPVDRPDRNITDGKAVQEDACATLP